MPKTISPERLALAAAHEQLLETQAALEVAQEAHRQALASYSYASSDLDEINTRIRQLDQQRCYGVAPLIAERNEQLRVAVSARECAEQAAHPHRVAEDEARRAAVDAERPVVFAQQRLEIAAGAVVVAEAEPVARAALAKLHEGLQIFLANGPDVIAMAHKGLLPEELAREVVALAGGLLGAAISWAPFEVRYRNSPWRAAKQLLQQDPTAPLPTGPTP